jgi:hypothetical protein
VNFEWFWSRVEKTDGCWLWRGAHDEKGYGRLIMLGDHIGAHRASWVITNGAIPDGLYVCHKCDNPPCVNPAHLFLGTHDENMADAIQKGRLRKSAHPDRLWLTRFGENHPRAKLTERDVLKIRELYAAGGVRMADIAEQFGISKTQTRSVIRGLRWSHLD